MAGDRKRGSATDDDLRVMVVAIAIVLALIMLIIYKFNL
jgi:hypothetical protein